MAQIRYSTRCSPVLSEQSLRTKQTLKETYFLQARNDLASLMINMSIVFLYPRPADVAPDV